MSQTFSKSLSTADWPTVTPAQHQRSLRADQTPGSDQKQSKILLLAITIAAAMHLAIIFGVTFDDIRERYIPPSLDVILVNYSHDSEPESADFLSEQSQSGGGLSDTQKRPTAPVSGSEKNNSTGEAQTLIEASSPEETQTATNESITQIFSEHKVEEQDQLESVPEITEAQQARALRTRMEIARLRAEIAIELEEQASRPKTLYVTASTKKSVAASYMLEWVKKVEKIGNQNYPLIAHKFSGSLVLVVGINQHGGITEVDVKRSSGNAQLDEAAVDIVKMAEPYAPMSSSLASETDVIYITRTWKFTGQHSLHTY